MDLLLWIVLGAVAGFLANVIMRGANGLFGDIILGIIGAFVGGFVLNAFGQPGVTGFNLYSVLVAALGAVVVIFLGRALQGGRLMHR